jgi:hypothetical protein
MQNGFIYVASTLIIPLSILVCENVHLINSLCNFLEIISPQSTNCPWFDVLIEIKNLILKIEDLISLVYYMNKCKKMNGVWFLHFTNTPLLCIDVCTMQNNILKHGFYNLFIYLFPFLLPGVGNFENI